MEKRALVFAPTGKDGHLIFRTLQRASLECFVCSDAAQMIRELGRGAGAVVLADEALTKEFLAAFSKVLSQQDTWSDLPVLLLSKRGLDSPGMRDIYLTLGNVTLLERPLQSVTLVSAVTAALRARERQYEMREIDRRKNEFLAMLAHELRNPLAPISAASELLSYAQLDQARIKKTSEIIARQVKHMTGLIDDLLDVSRVSRGLIALEHAELDARQIVGDAVEQVRPLVDQRRHTLAVQFCPEPASVNGDRKRLIQVLANMLNNAAKYSPEGSNIVLSMHADEHSVMFTVADDGIGMTPDFVDHVFEMFAQAKRTPDRMQGGLGIGLSLVKSLVELHGGTVDAYSEGIGKGSRFTVRLPRVRESASSHLRAGREAPLPKARSRRLLLVDDNEDAAHMLAMLLEAAGHEVLVEHNAAAGLERARSATPDVCLLDIGLPDMDGNELASQLRSQAATSRSLLVAITGYGQDHDRRKTAAAGFDHHFVKPVNVERLLHLLATIP